MHTRTVLDAPKRDRQAERREATRREILEAAWEVARLDGLGALTLRAVADRVGMRAPSLYSHFAAKMDIYDAMFEQAWTRCLSRMEACHEGLVERRRRELLPTREVLRASTRAYFDFSLEDPVRHQLMDLRTIPGFEPSPAAYAPSLAVLALSRRLLTELGLPAQEDQDLLIALVGGLVDAQLANDPGGDRWARQFDRAIDMYADAVGLPPAGERETAP